MRRSIKMAGKYLLNPLALSVEFLTPHVNKAMRTRLLSTKEIAKIRDICDIWRAFYSYKEIKKKTFPK